MSRRNRRTPTRKDCSALLHLPSCYVGSTPPLYCRGPAEAYFFHRCFIYAPDGRTAGFLIARGWPRGQRLCLRWNLDILRFIMAQFRRLAVFQTHCRDAPSTLVVRRSCCRFFHVFALVYLSVCGQGNSRRC